MYEIKPGSSFPSAFFKYNVYVISTCLNNAAAVPVTRPAIAIAPGDRIGWTAYTFVWDLGDVGVGLMTVFNLIALIPMSKEALVSLRDYEAKYKK